tara:strand:+ start:411 stop:578 length:168 start_codon:yes stop_codon:yes gene_type:complete
MKINDLIPDKVWYGLIGLNTCMFFIGATLHDTNLMILNLLSMASCGISLYLKTGN